MILIVKARLSYRNRFSFLASFGRLKFASFFDFEERIRTKYCHGKIKIFVVEKVFLGLQEASRETTLESDMIPDKRSRYHFEAQVAPSRQSFEDGRSGALELL